MYISRRGGFTLVELAIVIAVLVLLGAFFLPVLRNARDAAQQVQCATRLRAIGQAFIAYAADNDGHMVTTTASGISSYNWVFWRKPQLDINHSALAPYLGLRDDALRDMFRCPATPPENQLGFQRGIPYPLTFSMNGFLGTHMYPNLTFNRILNPSHKILLYDENENSDDDIFWYQTDRDTLAGRHGLRTTQAANVNGAGKQTVNRRMGNTLCFDGHVELADNDMCHSPEWNDPTVP